MKRVIEILHEALPGPGRLFAGPRPAPPFEAAAAHLSAAGITRVACLLEPAELLPALDAAYARAGLGLLRFPIPDMGVPGDTGAFRRFLLDLLGRLRAGETVYLHCLAGRGRTGTALACLLVLAGEKRREAVAAVRGCYQPDAVENDGQRRFVEAFGAGRPDA
jgi:Tyrosine phosphatase family